MLQSPFAVKEVSMNVICPDYLCILESGNLMHFTVVASCKEEQLSVIQTEDARLKVCDTARSLVKNCIASVYTFEIGSTNIWATLPIPRLQRLP